MISTPLPLARTVEYLIHRTTVPQPRTQFLSNVPHVLGSEISGAEIVMLANSLLPQAKRLYIPSIPGEAYVFTCAEQLRAVSEIHRNYPLPLRLTTWDETLEFCTHNAIPGKGRAFVPLFSEQGEKHDLCYVLERLERPNKPESPSLNMIRIKCSELNTPTYLLVTTTRAPPNTQ